jgi:hypothetical protein
VADQPFSLSTRPPEVAIASRNVQPPGFVYVTREDRLVVNIANSFTGAVIDITIRFLRPDGEIQRTLYTCRPTDDRVLNAFTFPLEEGFILGCIASHRTTGQIRRGQCYVLAALESGSDDVGLINGAVLFSGYATYAYAPAGPYHTLEHPFSGHGHLRLVTGADPAAGADFILTVPAGAIWRVISVVCGLVTDATATSRNAALQIDDGASGAGRYTMGTGVNASSTVELTWGPGATHAALGGVYHAPLPVELYLPGEWNLRGQTGNLQAADNYNAPRALVEEWLLP